MGRIPAIEILMIGLGWVEAAAFEPRHDRHLEGVRARQLRDIRSRRLLLRCRLREDRRTIARPAIRPLPVELRGIVSDREIDAKQRAVRSEERGVGKERVSKCRYRLAT